MSFIFSSASNWNTWCWNDDLQFRYLHLFPHSSTKQQHFVYLTISHFVWHNLPALLNVSFFKDRQLDWLLLNMQSNTITTYSGGGVHVVCFELYMFGVCRRKIYTITITELNCLFFLLFHSLSLKPHHFYFFTSPFLALVQWIAEFFDCAPLMVFLWGYHFIYLFIFYSVSCSIIAIRKLQPSVQISTEWVLMRVGIWACGCFVDVDVS